MLILNILSCSDVSEGELILVDYPMLISPHTKSKPQCLQCARFVWNLISAVKSSSKAVNFQFGFSTTKNHKKLLCWGAIMIVIFCLVLKKLISRLVSGSYKCSKCNFPMCDEICEAGDLHSMECSIFQSVDFEADVEFDGKVDDHYASILPLR